MKRMHIRIGCGFLAVFMMLILAGCGEIRTEKQSEKTGVQEEQNQETGIEVGKIEAVGRYVETKITLPGEEESIPREMEVLEDGSWGYFDGQTGYFVSLDEGVNWQLKYSISDLTPDQEEEPYFLDAAINSDGSLALIAADFADRDNLSAVLYIVNSDGGYNIVNGLLAQGEYLMGVEWRGKELYGFTGRSNICRIDLENGEMKKLFTSAERPEVIAFQGEKMLLLENNRVEIYNLAENKPEASDEVLDDFVCETFDGFLDTMGGSEVGLLVPDEQDAVYIVGSEGIFRHVLGGTAIEQVVDGRLSGLGTIEPGLSSFILYGENEFLVLTTTAGLTRMTYDAQQASRPENVLTIYSLYEMDGIRQAIGIYQKQNPDIWVDYRIGIPDDSAVVLEDALKNLNMELAAGTGPDVLILDGMDESVYIEKGVLMELSGFAETLTEKEMPIPNILQASYTGENLYVIPAVFGVPLLAGRTEDVERIHNVESLVQVAEELCETAQQSVTGCYSAGQELLQLLSVYNEDFLDGKRVNREELIRFLNYASRLYRADQKNITSDFQEILGHADIERSLGNTVEFLFAGLAGISYGIAEDMIYDLGAVETVMAEGNYSMKLFDEENSGFIPGCKLAVSVFTGQHQQAEAFLRVVLNDESQKMGCFYGFPVNQAAFLELCNDQDNDMCYGSGWRLPDGREIEFSADFPPRELTRELENIVSKLDHSMEQNSFMKEAILETGSKVLLGTMTAEEGAEEIERNVALYLAE